MSLRAIITSLILLSSISAQADTQVITLQNRTSADLLPIAQNFIGKNGKVSAYGNQLIVEAPAQKIQNLENLLSQLDKPARRLLITVDTSDTNLKVSVTPLDPTKEDAALPGDLIASGGTPLGAVTFAEFSILDSSGKRVNLKVLKGANRQKLAGGCRQFA